MKLNTKVFKALTNEPAKTVEYEDGIKLDIHFLEDSPFYDTFAAKGDFAQWSSDGSNFKLLIEKGFYETSEDLYRDDVNKEWLDFIQDVGKINKSITLKFMLPALVVYIVLVFLGLNFLPKETILIIGFAVVTFLVINMIQGRVVRNKISERRSVARDNIIHKIGKEKTDQLIEKQEAYIQTFREDYYKKTYGEDLYDEDDINEDGEVLEVKEIEESTEGDNDGEVY